MDSQLIPNSKKAQTGGLITALVFGVASLVIGVIIAFVIVSTLTGAGLLEGTRTTNSVINQTGYGLNDTGMQLTVDHDYVVGSISVSGLRNDTGTISATNYTVSSTGLITNTSEQNQGYINASFSYTLKSNEEVSTTGMSSNFTAGVDEISAKIPTVLLVAAIVLILGVLAILVGVWAKMKLGSSTEL